jgi:hypothetical protein
VRVFISHNAKDKETARLLAGLFADRGISFWFDEYEIKPGESITGGIGKGIEECDVFLLMWSAAAKASKWVDTEMRAAIRKRVDETSFCLIPSMLDDTALPPSASIVGPSVCMKAAMWIAVVVFPLPPLKLAIRNDHPRSVMTSCHDGGDRLSVQRGEVDWQGKRAT